MREKVVCKREREKERERESWREIAYLIAAITAKESNTLHD